MRALIERCRFTVVRRVHTPHIPAGRSTVCVESSLNEINERGEEIVSAWGWLRSIIDDALRKDAHISHNRTTIYNTR